MKKIISGMLVLGLLLGLGLSEMSLAAVKKAAAKKPAAKAVKKPVVVKKAPAKKVVKPAPKPVVVPPPKPIVVPPPRPAVEPPPAPVVVSKPKAKPAALFELGGSLGIATGLGGTPSGSSLGAAGQLTYFVMEPYGVRVGVNYLQSDQATNTGLVYAASDKVFKMVTVSVDGIYRLGKLLPDVVLDFYAGGGINYPVKISNSTLGRAVNGTIGGQAFVGIESSGVILPEDKIFGELGWSVIRIQDTTSFKGCSLMGGYKICF